MNFVLLDTGANQVRPQEPLVLIHRDSTPHALRTTILLGSAKQFSTARMGYDWAKDIHALQDARVVRTDSPRLLGFKGAT